MQRKRSFLKLIIHFFDNGRAYNVRRSIRVAHTCSPVIKILYLPHEYL